MKKAFTLIELLVTLVLSLIFFQFVLEFKFNFLNEIQTLKKENELAKNTYRLSQMVTKGFSYRGQYVNPMITLEEFDPNLKNIFAYDYFFSIPQTIIYTTSNKELIITKATIPITSYSYKKHSVPNRIIIEKASNTNGIYNLEWDNIDFVNEDIKYENYIKLVYTK